MTVRATIVSSCVFAILACGSISDPAKSKEAATAAPVAATDAATAVKIGGTLPGTSSTDGARVALVWRNGDNSLSMSGDVALTAGAFTIDLPVAPPDAAIVPADPDNGGFGGYVGGRPVTGTSALKSARAGLIVYNDTNANGHFDLDPSTGETSDKVIGGAQTFTLVYFADGSRADYEKVSDGTGTAAKAGYNLSWSGGPQGARWFDLGLVELTLNVDAGLPSAVCGLDIPTPDIDEPKSSVGFPPLGDPNLSCFNGGYAYRIAGWPLNNCSSWWKTPAVCSPSFCRTEDTIIDGVVPANWPCPVAGVDAGWP